MLFRAEARPSSQDWTWHRFSHPGAARRSGMPHSPGPCANRLETIAVSDVEARLTLQFVSAPLNWYC